MSEQGLCLRCNYAYATTIDDNMPVCESCKQKLNSEPVRICPVDKADMNKIIVKNILIDKCPKCHGIWLDGDEVGLLNGIAAGAFKDSSWANEEGKDGYGKFLKGFVLGAIVS